MNLNGKQRAGLAAMIDRDINPELDTPAVVQIVESEKNALPRVPKQKLTLGKAQNPR